MNTGILAAAALIVTDVATIVAVLVKLYKFISKWEKWTETKDRHDNENYLSVLRLTIMSREMPLSERIAAGDKYIKYGGNGAVKHKYEELIGKLPNDE